MGARKRIKNEKIVEVFKKKACNISATCSALDIDRKTFYAWKKKDANLAEMLDEACEALIDNAETMLLSKLNEGDLTAIIFFLKTKAKKRGYVEGREIDANVSTDIDLKPLTKEELEILAKGGK